MNEVANRRVLITGSSTVAMAVGSFFVRGGAAVAMMAAEGTSSEALVGSLPVRCDFGSECEVGAAVRVAERSLGRVDQVVHTWMADGVTDPQQFATISESTWLRCCERSLEGAWWLTRQVARPLRESARGSLVFVIPTVGLSGSAEFALLGTVCEGIRVLGKGVGRQWGQYGITVNIVTAAPEHWLDRSWDHEYHRTISAAAPAMSGPGDFGEDIAPLLSLIGDRGTHFLTSNTLVADGGVWMGL